MPQAGISSRKRKIVRVMASQRTRMMTTAPARGDRRPKKAGDHKRV